jgi:transaldolase/glucose-6-phosphate isomerase
MSTRPTKAAAVASISELGQSVWLDYIRRHLITSGKLAEMVEDRTISGMTSNPTIFEKAISGSSDYDEALEGLARDGVKDPYEAFTAIASEDIRMATDALAPIYEETGGADGFVSLELPPGLEHDIPGSIREARRLWDLVRRPNVMIKVPGTSEGVQILQQLTTDGVNPNMTLLFGVPRYEECANAYIAGLEARVLAGQSIDRIASVASFFVSRVDTKVDDQLPEDSPLRGKIAIANARRAYTRFHAIFSGERWERLAAKGARVQRPLWASTSTKNPAYRDVMYVEELVGPETVNTMPEATLNAVVDHARIRPALQEENPEWEAALEALPAAGVDLAKVADELLIEGLASFEKSFKKLLDQVESALDIARIGPPPPALELGPLGAAVESRLKALADDNIVGRTWDLDYTVWKPDPAEISNRLGWLSVVDTLMEDVPALNAFAKSVADEGYTTAVLLGMGGSSLAPEVLHETFGAARGFLNLIVLDTTDPEQIAAAERGLDLQKTLFIVASKSGTTLETRCHLEYFWAKIADGQHFIAITDPGTELAELGRERKFRRVFLATPELGGRYSALSHFGMVPAALIGVDLEALLDKAHEMLHACHACVPVAENPGAWLGAVIGEAAKTGRDKLTLVMPPELATFGYWAEQLLAESTGKEGRGVVPIEGEALGDPSAYGDDRLFVAIGEHPALDALASAGHPVVRLPYHDTFQLGSEFFRWEFATAVAGHILGINPFDQPNVQEAKDATNEILAGKQVGPATPSAIEVLETVTPGDYIAITAYLPRDEATESALDRARLALRDRYRVATTVGFGPRFLHSTGQLHKGGPNTGVFLQVVEPHGPDLPIPGKPYTFGRLQEAQALGDLASLRSHGRRVSRVTMTQLKELVG